MKSAPNNNSSPAPVLEILQSPPVFVAQTSRGVDKSIKQTEQDGGVCIFSPISQAQLFRIRMAGSGLYDIPAPFVARVSTSIVNQKWIMPLTTKIILFF